MEPITCCQSLILDKAMLLSSFSTNSSPVCSGSRGGTFDERLDSKSILPFIRCSFFSSIPMQVPSSVNIPVGL